MVVGSVAHIRHNGLSYLVVRRDMSDKKIDIHASRALVVCVVGCASRR
jgi:hypothetical protein